MATSMKVTRPWLQKFFDAPLPEAEAIADALTFHAFEIEGTAGELLDVNILPDRAADALSMRGIAREVAAVLPLPLSRDPLRAPLPEHPETDELSVVIEDPQKCLRYMGAIVSGVKVGPSPAWLKEALESVGQRSINNVVDATNYVMLDIGQPLHAFDAGKLAQKEGTYAIKVRGALEGEKITALTGEEYALPEDTLLITDANADAAIGIAGIKGGRAAEVTEATTDLIIEAANFEGSSIRRAAQALRLWTDASLRFQNRPSPALAAYGMRDALALITEIAGGEVRGVIDVYPAQADTANAPLSVALARVNGLLGTAYAMDEVASAFDRLGFAYATDGETFIVTPPFERRDLTIPETLVEEAGRILGLEHIPAAALPEGAAPDQARYRGIERIKDFLVERGYTEISTQSFAAEGEVELANPLDATKPWLRASLAANMRDALARGANVAPLVLGPDPFLKLFEAGTVFAASGEHLSLALGYRQISGKKYAAALGEIAQQLGDEFGLHTSILDEGVAEADLSAINLEALGADYQPKKVALGTYRPFSQYPFALRDVAVWTPEGTEESQIALIIEREAGELLARIDLFDRYQKDDRLSFAFRLVFQSLERTLSDADLDPLMQKVTEALNAQEGWEVR